VIHARRLTKSGVRWLSIWTPFVAAYGGILLVQSNGAMSALAALQAAAHLALVPGLLAIVVWWLTSIVLLPERKPLRFAAIHLALAAVFSAISTWWFIRPLITRADVPLPTVWRSVLPWQIINGLFMYGLIAAVSYAIRGTWGARDLRLATERAERLRAQAELAALRAHINPHFLFNTLHSVTQLLRSDPSRAEAALERLSDLFRYALRLDRERLELVSLEDEWRFTASYLWLEQMRMGDRLTIESSFSDDALACAVPPFILQPLVENAVRHGLGPSRAGGTVALRATEAEGRLTIDVCDDGVGAQPMAVENGTGIGVRSVRQRLEARHGAKSRVEIVTAVGKGTRVTLTLPAEAAS
jgi:signal transduction histidine kinase